MADQTLLLMHLVAEIGSLLTRLPAQTDRADVHAGLTFTMPRQALSWPSRHAAAELLREAAQALAHRLSEFAAEFPALRRHAETLLRWQPPGSDAQSATPSPAPAPPAAPIAAPSQAGTAPKETDTPATEAPVADVAVGQAVTLRFDTGRCGHSKHKPFCDSSHLAEGGGEAGQAPFTASGEAATRPSEPLPARGGPLRVEPLRNGPVEVSGPLEICCGTGRTIDRVTTARLCRCGQSRDKPFCDGSHAVVGFVAAGV